MTRDEEHEKVGQALTNAGIQYERIFFGSGNDLFVQLPHGSDQRKEARRVAEPMLHPTTFLFIRWGNRK